MKLKISLLTCLFCLCLIVSVSAQIPSTMNYQGSLKDANGNPVTDTVEMTFALYDSLTGGIKLWEETQGSVNVVNGIYSVILGTGNSSTSLSSLAYDVPYYLEISINGEALSPRQPLTSVPYAFNCASSTVPTITGMTSWAYSWKDASTVTVPAGQVTTGDGTTLTLSTATDVSLDSQLDTGAKAANQGYFLWIGKDSGNQTVLRFSLSATSPTGLSSAYRLSNFVETDANGDIIRFSAPLPAGTPSGTIHMWAGEYAPLGCGFCDGHALSRTSEAFSKLFGIIGTKYGTGDDSTTFNLPDLRGRSPLGAGQGDNLTERSLGKTGGEEEHTLTIDEMPNHSHHISYTGPGTGNKGFGYYTSGQGSKEIFSKSAGGDQPHNNMQPYQVVNFIIKY